MPQEELIAEQMAIHTCSTLIRWLVRDDPSVCRILEEILEEEEARVKALAGCLGGAAGAAAGAGETSSETSEAAEIRLVFTAE